MITDFYVKIKTEKPFLCLLLTNIVVMHKYKSKRKAPPYLRKTRGHGAPSHIQLSLNPFQAFGLRLVIGGFFYLYLNAVHLGKS